MGREWFRGILSTRDKVPKIDTSVAHPARVYDWIWSADCGAAWTTPWSAAKPGWS